MILLDTTVLVYAVGGEHPLAAPARQLIADMREGLLKAHTTPEVIQKFAHVRARRRSREDAEALATAFATACAPLQVITGQHLEAGLRLWRDQGPLSSFDAVLAALAISLDAELISADRAFASIPQLRWRDLAA